MNSDRPSEKMPCNEDLLPSIGRVTWAAIRLQHYIRDKIGRLEGATTDEPFNTTLGGACKNLKDIASDQGVANVVTWCDDIASPAIEGRNGLLHSIGYTHSDGRQALQGSKDSRSRDYTNDEILDIADALVEASTNIPS